MTANQIAYRNYEEQVRHNREMERLTGESQAETARHYRATESEQYRTDLANESIKKTQNVLNWLHDMVSVSESKRHSKAQEQETQRHNEVTEYYTLVRPATGNLDLLLIGSNVRKNYASATQAHAQADLLSAQAKSERLKQNYKYYKWLTINEMTSAAQNWKRGKLYSAQAETEEYKRNELQSRVAANTSQALKNILSILQAQ